MSPDRQKCVCRLPQSENDKDSEYVSQEKEYWKECFPWNPEKSHSLCAVRKNEKLPQMVQKGGAERVR